MRGFWTVLGSDGLLWLAFYLLSDLWPQVVELWATLRALIPDDTDWPIGLVSLLLLLLIARVAAWHRRRSLAHEVLQLVRDTHSHPVKAHLGPDDHGFVAESNPAPEPFAQLMILYIPSSRLDPLGLARWLLGRHAQTLHIRGMLRRMPTAELLWRRHMKPAAALARVPDAHTWLQRGLDFTDAQYSTRGIDTAAIEHVFAEFQTRFGPNLQAFIVRSEAQPQVEIILAAPRLDPMMVAGFLISLRSVGRAACN